MVTKDWRKSSFCGANNSCVDVRIHEAGVDIRNSEHPNDGVMFFTHDEWKTFIMGAKAGEFDLV